MWQILKTDCTRGNNIESTLSFPNVICVRWLSKRMDLLRKYTPEYFQVNPHRDVFNLLSNSSGKMLIIIMYTYSLYYFVNILGLRYIVKRTFKIKQNKMKITWSTVSNLSCLFGIPRVTLKIPDPQPKSHKWKSVGFPGKCSTFLRGLNVSHPLPGVWDPLISPVSLILQMKKLRPREVEGLAKGHNDR